MRTIIAILCVYVALTVLGFEPTTLAEIGQLFLMVFLLIVAGYLYKSKRKERISTKDLVWLYCFQKVVKAALPQEQYDEIVRASTQLAEWERYQVRKGER
jgi:hypothetical protein